MIVARHRVSLFPIGGLIVAIFLQQPLLASSAASTSELQTDFAGELAAYASLGSQVASRMRLPEQGWTKEQLGAFIAGLRAASFGKPIFGDLAAQQIAKKLEERLSPLQPLAAASKPSASVSTPGASVDSFMRSVQLAFRLQKSESGLFYRIAGNGAGPRPRLQDVVVLNLDATAADGKTALPQLSGRNVRVAVDQLLPGLAEAVQMLALGGRMILAVPPHLSFGTGAWPAGVEKDTPLLFDLTLEEILAKQTD